MKNLLKTVSLAIAVVVAGAAAHAVTITSFNTPLSAGDGALGSATAAAHESFANATLSTTAATDLELSALITVNPSDLFGSSDNISLSYAVNGAATTAITVFQSVFRTGFAGLDLSLDAGDTLEFFVNGTAGGSGNVVSFSVTTSAPSAGPSPAPVPLPAAGFMLLAGLGGLVAMRKRAA